MRTVIGQAVSTARILPRQWNAAARMLPDFIIIGAQKAGTSSLYFHLMTHPDVAGSLRKEVHFFDNNFRRGLNWYRANFPTRATRDRIQNETGRRFIAGEASPYYLLHPLCPQRVSATLPDVRLIVLLRNPVDRAYSHYNHEVTLKRERLSFEEAIDREPLRVAGERERLLADGWYRSNAWQRHTYLTRGHYAEQLERWFDVFPREQILIHDSDRFHRDTAGVYADVQRFLGLEHHAPAQFKRHYARSYAKMQPETRQRLQDYFRPHNERLEELLGRTFPWDRDVTAAAA